MRLLVVGSGAREHALSWRLQQELADSDRLFIAPGISEASRIGKNVPIRADSAQGIQALADFAQEKGIDMTVVGPEAPLAAGIADAFNARGLRIFGPSQRAAKIESSKAYAKLFMKRHGIPTADFYLANSAYEALDLGEYLLRKHGRGVVKADGLAGGKGVVPYASKAELERGIKEIMSLRAGDRFVLEKFLDGEEASFIAWTDGRHAVPLVTTQDHKRVFDGDCGPNTGGMGAYTNPVVAEGIEGKIMEKIIMPAIKGLAAEGRRYRGVLYAGVMIDDGVPSALEFNCRYGDPETQVAMPLLRSSLLDITFACAEGGLDKIQAGWHPQEALCVVLATKGYPGDYSGNLGNEISGLDNLPDYMDVFHAGTKYQDGRTVNAGGRVLSVVAKGSTLQEAQERTYSTIGPDGICFDGMHYRKDIGDKTLGR